LSGYLLGGYLAGVDVGAGARPARGSRPARRYV